jgi:hypothetical protein
MFSLESVPSAGGESSLSASLRPLARRAALPEPPHVALANTSLEPKAIAAFTRRYGPIVEPISSFAGDGPRNLFSDADLPFTTKDLLSLGADEAVQETFSFSPNDFAEKQDCLRLAWRGERTALASLKTGCGSR